MTIVIPDWSRTFVTATTETEERETITRYTSWRAVLDPTRMQRYPTTCDEWELDIVADDQEHDCDCLDCAAVHGSPCDSNATILCGMSVPDGGEEDILTAAQAALTEQGFQIDGFWRAGPNGTMTAKLVPAILDPTSSAYEPETAASMPKPRLVEPVTPPMRFCRCGQYANRVFTPLDPHTGAPDQEATFYRCHIHAYDADVPQENVRQRSICWRGVQFGPDPLCLEPIEFVAEDGVITGWYHVDRRITADHHAINRI